MKKLSPSWFVEGLVDVEYKQYVLLSYLQDVHQHFTERRLYPDLADLIEHYRQLQEYRNLKDRLNSQFPREVERVDWSTLQLRTRPTVEDPDVLQDIDTVVDFALPLVQKSLRVGTELYDEIEETLRFEPVGVLPLYRQEGYLFIRMTLKRETDIYRYRVNFFIHHNEPMTSIETQYLTTWLYAIGNTYEQMKNQLILHRTELPNPATWLVELPAFMPVDETILPITKRLLFRQVRPPQASGGSPR